MPDTPLQWHLLFGKLLLKQLLACSLYAYFSVCNCINYLPNQFTQIISSLRNWDEKPVQFFFHDLLMDFHSVKPNILIQFFLFRIQFLEVKCPKSVRCQQKHLWHTIGCNKENPSKRVTECNKRTREKHQNKNRRPFFAATI